MTNNIYLTPDELAERWKMSKDTLANWRIRKTNVAYTKIGDGRNTRVLYKLEDVIEFENRNIISNNK